MGVQQNDSLANGYTGPEAPEAEVPPVAVPGSMQQADVAQSPSRRRDCQFAATPSSCSRRFESGGEGTSVEWQNSSPTASVAGEQRARLAPPVRGREVVRPLLPVDHPLLRAAPAPAPKHRRAHGFQTCVCTCHACMPVDPQTAFSDGFHRFLWYMPTPR